MEPVYIGCPEAFSLHNGVCTPNKCQHEGQLALGSKHIECICKAPWDGRWCERLACWRMAPKEHERRWRNANNDHCKCADGFQGENCDKIVFCKNGELVGGRCQCAEALKEKFVSAGASQIRRAQPVPYGCPLLCCRCFSCTSCIQPCPIIQEKRLVYRPTFLHHS
uniref:EGF-like domain-containing protein n=1 Tax=Ditylenchus dipsaci TaxID=166011 RepID=A0A915D0R5_9BILA